MNSFQNDTVAQDLNDIKKLLILLLLKREVTQIEISNALGVDNSVISRMMSAKKKTGRKK